jgi:hypothetical protein
MYEETEGFGAYVAELFATATHEAHIEAMKTMGYVVIARSGYIIKLYPDNSYDIIKKINGSATRCGRSTHNALV